jgi:hypothetical protein
MYIVGHLVRYPWWAISDWASIGLSRYRTERLKICWIFRYRTKVFSDILYPTSKFLKSCCPRSLKKQTELNLGCFKSSPALTSQNSSRATSVKLVHTLSNNFYFKGFSIGSKTGPIITDVYRMFQKFHSPNQLKYLKGDFSTVSSHLEQQLLLIFSAALDNI